MTQDKLDSALAFVLQSNRRLWDAERVEDMVARKLRTPMSVRLAAEEATRAAATVLDAASTEFTDQIKDYVKQAVMDAIAAIPT